MSRRTRISYSPDFCGLAISMAQDGAGKRDIAHEIGVPLRVLRHWEALYEQFREALIPAFKNDLRRKLRRADQQT